MPFEQNDFQYTLNKIKEWDYLAMDDLQNRALLQTESNLKILWDKVDWSEKDAFLNTLKWEIVKLRQQIESDLTQNDKLVKKLFLLSTMTSVELDELIDFDWRDEGDYDIADLGSREEVGKLVWTIMENDIEKAMQELAKNAEKKQDEEKVAGLFWWHRTRQDQLDDQMKKAWLL